MKRRSLTHVPDEDVRHGLHRSIGSERGSLGDVLLHVAEFDARKLYLAEGYSSMYAYCLGALHLSEDAAYKRIQAARAAQKFPAILDAIEEGRLHLTAVVLLKPHLTPENAEELLAAAMHQTKAQIELLLAERFPRPDVPTRVQFMPSVAAPNPATGERPAPASALQATELVATAPTELVPEPVPQRGTSSMPPPVPRANVAPLSPGRFALQVTVSQATHDKLRHAQALLGHQIPSGDMAQVIDRALDALIAQVEKQKLAATSRPRATPPCSKPGSRHVPAHVKRAVRQRDRDQCAFVGASGRRCDARARLEFHHVRDFARGGEATVEGIELRCRAHNQHDAERSLGMEFMRRKRLAAAQARAAGS